MERIEKLIAQKIEARLEAKLDAVLDSILEKAIGNALARILGVEAEAPEAKAKTAPEAKAKTAEAETPEAKLLARLERVASGLGEKYGPMLVRRARSLAKHALNPAGALAVMVAWAEAAPPEDIVAVLRGSERLPDGTTLSGWRLMAAKLGIPVKE